MQSIHHVAYIVRDLDAALPLFEDRYGLSVILRETLVDQQVEALALGVGPGQIELIAPTTNDSGAARYLESRGEGLHHVAYAVDDLQAELDRLAGDGLELIDRAPRRGLGGAPCCVYPSSLRGRCAHRTCSIASVTRRSLFPMARQIELGFKGGSVIRLSVEESSVESLTAALDDGGWFELDAKDGRHFVNLGEATHLKIEDLSGPIGFGGD